MFWICLDDEYASVLGRKRVGGKTFEFCVRARACVR